MAWRTIAATETDPGAPFTSELAKAYADNPGGIAEGATGAPRIDPIAAMAHQGAVGAVGTYAMLARADGSAASPGTTLAGSSLRYAGAPADISIEPSANVDENSISTTAPAGTWRCMGFISAVDSSSGTGSNDAHSIKYATLWLRIS